MGTLKEMREELARQNQQFSGSNAIYPHWNIEEGETVTVRFLPDGNDKNVFFWAERQMLRLPFPGVKGDPNSKPLNIQVPCMEMWEPKDSCPVLKEVRTWFKDPDMEETAKKYWKKRSYIFQGFIVGNNPLDEDSPDNPIRRFIMGPQLFEGIRDVLTDEELEELPTDTEQGLDFIIKKTKKGSWANYDTSKWARKERALSDEERAAIDEHKLFNLADFLPNKPDAATLGLIFDMFEASVDGQSFDNSLWGQFNRNVDADKTTPVSTVAKASAQEDDEADEADQDQQGDDDVVETTDKDVTEAPKKGNQDIMDLIKTRKKQRQDS